MKSNCDQVQDQNEYTKRYEELSKRFDDTKKKLAAVENERDYKKGQTIRLNAFIEKIKATSECITEWDQEIWNFMLESAIVNRDGSITFKFKNGTEFREII